MTNAEALVKRIRTLLALFILGLVVSGLTAIPLETELRLLARAMEIHSDGTSEDSLGLRAWVSRVEEGLIETNKKYPFLAYGTDWLAFAHIVIAVAFIEPWRDPVRNVWVVEFGMIACGLVVLFALGMGPIRGIPIGWTLIDCSFGVLGVIPLWVCRRYINQLGCSSAAEQTKTREIGRTGA